MEDTDDLYRVYSDEEVITYIPEGAMAY